MLVSAVIVAGCSTGGDDSGSAPSTSQASSSLTLPRSTTAPVQTSTSVTVPQSTTAVPTTRSGFTVVPTPTTAPRTTAPPVTAATPSPGSPCTLGSNPDCIDPDGDGRGTYLIDGAQCMRDLAEIPEMCTDLDGDGRAGYNDAG